MPRPRLGPILTLIVAVALAGCGSATDPDSGAHAPDRSTAVKRPNIVLVISDDQDHAHLGFMGETEAQTPNLDALAARGTVFTTVHTPARCRASLAMLLSGRWPHQSGIYANRQERTLPAAESLPKLLARAGYATFMGGKFWEGDPAAMGFEAPAESSEEFVREGQEQLFAFLADLDDERPFFVWWAPKIPHMPHDPPKRYLDRFDRASIPIPDWYPGDPEVYRELEHASLAMVAWFDDEFGKLESKLRELGRFDDTLFVFLIDNGYANGLVAKGSPYEKGVRTPLVVSWPGEVLEGLRDDRLTSSVDVFPTLLDFAGVEPPERIAGRSLRPILTGAADSPPAASVLAGAAYGREASEGELAERDVYALYARDQRWKYILYIHSFGDVVWDNMRGRPPFRLQRERGEEELFDLEADPLELSNLAHDPDQRERMDELRRAAVDWWQKTGGGRVFLPE